MIICHNQYEIGSIVYLKTDHKQRPRIVTYIIWRSADLFLYGLACGTEEAEHREFEISAKKEEQEHE